MEFVKNIFLRIQIRLLKIILLTCRVIVIFSTALFLATGECSVAFLLSAIWVYVVFIIVYQRLLVSKFGIPFTPYSDSAANDRFFIESFKKQKDKILVPSNREKVKISIKDRFLGVFFPKKFPLSYEKFQNYLEANRESLESIIGRQIIKLDRLETAFEMWIYIVTFIGWYLIFDKLQYTDILFTEADFTNPLSLLSFLTLLFFISLVLISETSNARDELNESIKLYKKQQQKGATNE